MDSNTGVVAAGREADLLVMDAPLGSQADDALGALAIGDTPAVVTAIIDGDASLHEEPQYPAAGATGVVLELVAAAGFRVGES